MKELWLPRSIRSCITTAQTAKPIDACTRECERKISRKSLIDRKSLAHSRLWPVLGSERNLTRQVTVANLVFKKSSNNGAFDGEFCRSAAHRI
jgi:hypothetical protein